MQFTITDACGSWDPGGIEVVLLALFLLLPVAPPLLWYLRRKPEAGLLLATGPHGDLHVERWNVTAARAPAAIAPSPRLFQAALSTASGLDLLLTAHVLFAAMLARQFLQLVQAPTLRVAAISLAVATLAAWVRPHRAWLHVLNASIFLLAIELLTRSTH